MKHVLIFDVPRDNVALAVKVWRDLNKLGAKKIQHSVWSSENLDSLVRIASFIKKSGGSARILEERFIF